MSVGGGGSAPWKDFFGGHPGWSLVIIAVDGTVGGMISVEAAPATSATLR